MTTTYLLDNNIYSILRRTPGAFRKFNATIRETGIIPTNDVKLRMTTSSIIEAVGVTLKDPEINIPSNIIKGTVSDIFSYLLKTAKTYFESAIIKNDFIEKATIESAFTIPEAKELEEKCVWKPLSSNNFEKLLAQDLALDFAFKFDFPNRMDYDLHDKFFVNALFTDFELIAGVSKFRLAKKFWDKHHQKIRKVNSHQLDTIDEINKSLKLKKFQDFLDCDIVHFVTVGDYVQKTFRPTVAFTTDEGQVIVNRVMAYKTYIDYLKENLDENLKTIFTPTIEKWRQGILVFCNPDGTIKNLMEVKDIQAFR